MSETKVPTHYVLEIRPRETSRTIRHDFTGLNKARTYYNQLRGLFMANGKHTDNWLLICEYGAEYDLLIDKWAVAIDKIKTNTGEASIEG